MNEIADGLNKVAEFQNASDNFQPEYITNTEWNCSSINMSVAVSFRFTLISTDVINSTELASLLKYWVRQQSVSFRGGISYNITVKSAQCIDDHYIGPNTVTCINTPYGDPPPTKSSFYNIISCVIVAVIVLVAFGLPISCCAIYYYFCIIKKKNKNKVTPAKKQKE